MEEDTVDWDILEHEVFDARELLPAHCDENEETTVSPAFCERISNDEYQFQSTNYTRNQLQEFYSMLERNPSLMENTLHFKEQWYSQIILWKQFCTTLFQGVFILCLIIFQISERTSVSYDANAFITLLTVVCVSWTLIYQFYTHHSLATLVSTNFWIVIRWIAFLLLMLFYSVSHLVSIELQKYTQTFWLFQKAKEYLPNMYATIMFNDNAFAVRGGSILIGNHQKRSFMDWLYGEFQYSLLQFTGLVRHELGHVAFASLFTYLEVLVCSLLAQFCRVLIPKYFETAVSKLCFQCLVLFLIIGWNCSIFLSVVRWLDELVADSCTGTLGFSLELLLSYPSHKLFINSHPPYWLRYFALNGYFTIVTAVALVILFTLCLWKDTMQSKKLAIVILLFGVVIGCCIKRFIDLQEKVKNFQPIIVHDALKLFEIIALLAVDYQIEQCIKIGIQ